MPHSFSVYNASAGSGKTYTLAKEYIKILLLSKNNDRFSNILAITFTNKAVGEMKKRILDYLIDFSQKNINDENETFFEDIKKETGLNEDKIFSKSKLVLNNLLQNYASFDISTIDKFTLKLVKNFALELGINAQFEVFLDDDYIQEQAIDLMISQIGEEEEITKIVMEYAKNQVIEDGNWDITNNIKDVSKVLQKETFRENLEEFKNKTLEEIIKVKENLIIDNKRLKSEIIEKGKRIQGIISNLGIPEKDFSGQYFPKYLIKVVDFNLQSNNLKLFDFIKLNKTSKFTIDDLPKEIEDFLLFIQKTFLQYSLNQDIIKNLTPLSLLNKVVQKISEIEDNQNIMMLSKFNQLIYNEIKNQPALYIYERIGERYKHFFIDEFQDTSQLQWLNLIPLMNNAISSEDLNEQKGTLMVVGDPKQSIYRFRGGKPEILLDISKENNIQDINQNPFNTLDKKVYNLDTNYRSFSEVIEFNNDFFKYISGNFENEDYKKLFDIYSNQKVNNKKGGCVTLTFTDKENLNYDEELDNSEVMVLKVLERIKECKNNGFEYNEMAILVNKNANGVLIAKKLIDEGIKVISSESLLLSSSDEVLTLIYFLKLIQNEKDEAILANFIYQLYQNNETFRVNNTSVFIITKEAIDFCKKDTLSNFFQKNGFAIDLENLKSKPLYTIVQEIMDILLNNPKNNAYLQTFLEIVWDKSINSKFNTNEFLEFFEQKKDKLSISTNSTADAVIILSIHKSKGLEFPVVIFPFVNQKIISHYEKIFLPIENQSIEYGLVTQKNDFKGINDGINDKLDQLSEEQKMDTINKLYVALTRAKEQLHIISTMQLKNGNEIGEMFISKYFLRFLQNKNLLQFEQLEYVFGDLKRVSKPKISEDKALPIQNVKEKLSFSQIKIAKNKALLWDSEQEKAIDFGNFIHDLMQNIFSENDIKDVLNDTLRNGNITVEEYENLNSIISKIVLHHDLKVFFDKKLKILNEQKIIIPNQNVLIPDRLVINNDKVSILDYKTGKKENYHKTQILSYKKTLQEMNFMVEKTVLVYINEEIEVVEV